MKSRGNKSLFTNGLLKSRSRMVVLGRLGLASAAFLGWTIGPSRGWAQVFAPVPAAESQVPVPNSPAPATRSAVAPPNSQPQLNFPGPSVPGPVSSVGPGAAGSLSQTGLEDRRDGFVAPDGIRRGYARAISAGVFQSVVLYRTPFLTRVVLVQPGWHLCDGIYYYHHPLYPGLVGVFYGNEWFWIRHVQAVNAYQRWLCYYNNFWWRFSPHYRILQSLAFGGWPCPAGFLPGVGYGAGVCPVMRPGVGLYPLIGAPIGPGIVYQPGVAFSPGFVNGGYAIEIYNQYFGPHLAPPVWAAPIGPSIPLPRHRIRRP